MRIICYTILANENSGCADSYMVKGRLRGGEQRALVIIYRDKDGRKQKKRQAV